MSQTVELGTDGLVDALGVSEAARLVGVSPSTLRLWERQGLVRPFRSPGGARRYDRRAVEILRQIARLRREEGWNAAAIRDLLGDESGHADDGDGDPSGQRRSRRAVTTGRKVGGWGVPERGAAHPGPEVDEEPRETARPAASRPGPSLGARLRALRTRRQLTLREVAARSGLSVSFLSAVERGLSGISVAALRRTLAACDATLAELQADPAARPPVGQRTRLVRRGERRVIETEGGVRIEDLAVEATLLEPQLFVLAPGATSDGTYHHPGEEFMFVLAGRVGVWLAEAEYYELGPGDALTYPSTLPHRFACLGPDEARLIWVNTPPSF